MPDGKFVKSLEEPEPINVYIDFNDPNFDDPYYLLFSTIFHISIKDAPKPVLEIEVSLDNQILDYEVESNNASFSLYPHSYSEGSHLLTVRAKLATESGSLADRLGTEYYIVEKQITVIIDRSPPPSIPPITANYENGFLTIRWNHIDQNNFIYRINRTYDPYNPLFDSIVYNTDQDYFIDPGYIGGNINYELWATGYAFDQLLGQVNFNESPINFDINFDEKKVVHIKWSDVKIDTVNTSLYINGYYNKSFPLTSEGEILMDTLALGGGVSYWLKLERTNFPRQQYSQVREIVTNPNINEFRNFVMLPNNNKLILFDFDNIYRYSLPDFILEDSVSRQDLGIGRIISVVVDNNESKMLLSADPGTLLNIEPLNFNIYSSIDVHSNTTSATGTNQSITKILLGNLSNNGLVTFNLSRQKTWSIIYDINTDEVKWISSYFSNYPSRIPPTITNDGKYFVVDKPIYYSYGEVYKYDVSSFNKIGLVRKGLKYFNYDNHELINCTAFEDLSIPTEANFIIYDIGIEPNQPEDTFNIARQHDLPIQVGNKYISWMGYDDITKSLITEYEYSGLSVLSTLDINTFQEIATRKAQPYSGKYFFSNNYHFITRGYIESIK